MKASEFQWLLCPECFGDAGKCDRCQGKGSIKVVVPQGDVPADMRELFAPKKQEAPVKPALSLADYVVRAACFIAIGVLLALSLGSIIP